jgi:hypothetical protein
MNKLSKREQERIKGLLENGKSQRQVADECKVSLGVVNKIAKVAMATKEKTMGEMDDLAKEALKFFAPVPSADLESKMLSMLRELFADKEPFRLAHQGGGESGIHWQIRMYANRTGRYALYTEANDDGSLKNAIQKAIHEGWMVFIKGEKPEWSEWLVGKDAYKCTQKIYSLALG